MKYRILAAVLASVAFQAAATPVWRAVPGAPEVGVDLGSSRIAAGSITAWVRFDLGPEAPAALHRLAAQAAGAMPAHRRLVLRVRADCRRQSLAVEAVQAYSPAGMPVFMSSTPGPSQRLSDDSATGWVYDALCEWMRAAS